MTATAAQVQQLRRMAAEPTEDTYSDEELQAVIERYPLIDEQGKLPYSLSAATPPARVANPEWIASYDLNAAAADIWEEKAATVSAYYDFSADGASFSQSKLYDQYMANVRHYRARRAIKTVRAVKYPEETSNGNFPWIGNLPEDDD